MTITQRLLLNITLNRDIVFSFFFFCWFLLLCVQKVSSGCSKALWSMPMTRFVDEYSVGGGFGKPGVQQ
jgi:hypothetical protein